MTDYRIKLSDNNKYQLYDIIEFVSLCETSTAWIFYINRIDGYYYLNCNTITRIPYKFIIRSDKCTCDNICLIDSSISIPILHHKGLTCITNKNESTRCSTVIYVKNGDLVNIIALSDLENTICDCINDVPETGVLLWGSKYYMDALINMRNRLNIESKLNPFIESELSPIFIVTPVWLFDDLSKLCSFVKKEIYWNIDIPLYIDLDNDFKLIKNIKNKEDIHVLLVLKLIHDGCPVTSLKKMIVQLPRGIKLRNESDITAANRILKQKTSIDISTDVLSKTVTSIVSVTKYFIIQVAKS